jgi:hypothetical protein
LKYDAMSGLAHFERKDGRMATAPLAKLSEADRRFIAEVLGDVPLQFSGPGITPPPISPTVVNLVDRGLKAVGMRDLPITLPVTWALPASNSAVKPVGTRRVAASGPGQPSGRLVTLKAVKQPGDTLESLPPPENVAPELQSKSAEARYIWPRVAFYGCRGTWHLIDGMGTASYQYHGHWWLTALKQWPSPPGWWFYKEAPTLNNTGRYWAFKLWKTPCGYVCGHGCGGCHHGCVHHHHHYYGFEVWLWHQAQWHLFDCAHVVRMRPFGYGDDLSSP